jgi:hypothetical protein
MGVSKKGRRKIVVGDKIYFWNVEKDNDSPYYILNIISDDKYLILSCPLKAEVEYVISKGGVFKTKKTDGCWNRYLLPFHIPDIITPKFVERLIEWSVQDTDTVRIDGIEVPV